MNTCARIESTGQKGRIHVSKETADLLAVAGKGNWVVPRMETVHAKGKGELESKSSQIYVQPRTYRI